MACHGISEAIENLSLSETQTEGLGARPKVSERREEKQSRRRNRKDKRRAGLEDSVHSKPPPMSRVEKLRAERQLCSVVTDTSQGSLVVRSVSLTTEIKNLPDSFFSDNLVGDREAEGSEARDGRDLKKRRRRKQKRKQSSTEEEDKLSSENIEEKLNDKLIDDDPGEEIVTNFGDEQCVVS